MLGVTIKKHNDDTQSHEASLRDIQEQLTEAQKLEEAMKKDLKRITKDIEHLQRKDLETRNEISTHNSESSSTQDRFRRRRFKKVRISCISSWLT